MTKKNDTFLSHITNIFWKFFKALTIFLAYQSGVGAIRVFGGIAQSLRDHKYLARGGIIQYESTESSTLKIMMSDLCIQATEYGPKGCHQTEENFMEEESFMEKDLYNPYSNHYRAKERHRISALSVAYKTQEDAYTKYDSDGRPIPALYICQTRTTASLNTTFCGIYPTDLFRPCQPATKNKEAKKLSQKPAKETSNAETKLEKTKISNDVTIGDADLIRRLKKNRFKK